MPSRPVIRANRRREQILLSHPQFWSFVFKSIRAGQNMPGLCKVLGVSYHATMARIRASKPLMGRFLKAKTTQLTGIEKKWRITKNRILSDIREGEQSLANFQRWVDENEEEEPEPKDPFWDLRGQVEIKKKS